MKSVFTLCFIFIIQISQIKSQCWQQVSMGRNHGLAIHVDGTLWVWGFNQYGSLGDGTNISKSIPTRINSDADWKQISAGEDYSLAIKNDGTLWAWGRNEYGLLGDGTEVNSNVPKKIGTDTNWKQVSAGIHQAAAIKNDGSVWLWGYYRYDVSPPKGTPKQLLSISNCSQVSSGRLFYTFLLDDGSLWSLGSNASGQLGDGTKIDRITPVRVGVSNSWSFISSGGDHNLAIQKDGTLWAWGSGGSGEIGDGSNLDRLTPQKIGTSKDWKQVSAGYGHSMGVRNFGTLWAWGDNYDGQLGIGSKIAKNIPTKVGTGSNWDFVEAGELRVSIALRKDGSTWACGDNSYGQLGDSTKITKDVLVQVICPVPNPKTSIWEYQALNLPLLSRGWESKIVNENVVWFYGEGGSLDSAGFQKDYTSYTFARTVNGGKQWMTGVFPFNGKEGDLTHMAAIDDSTAWVTYVESTESGFANYDSKVYKTTDGGKTWVLANINIGSNWVNCIHFFNENEGVIIADATSSDFNIYTTSDGGTSWTKVDDAGIPDIVDGDEYGVNFLTTVGDQIWFPTWAGRIFYSPDKGKTWQALDGPEGAIGLIWQISADDAGNIYVDEEDFDNVKHRFLRRNISDGLWTNLTGSSNDGYIFFDCIPGTQNIMMCNTTDYKTRISRDNGQSWIVIDTINNNSKYFVNFINSKTGFCSNRERGIGTNSILKYIGSPLSGLLSQQILNLDLKLYPNPSVDQVSLKFDIPTKDHFWILVHDVAGNLLYKKSIHQEGTYLENIDISHFISGTYFLTVSNQDGLKSLTFVKI